MFRRFSTAALAAAALLSAIAPQSSAWARGGPRHAAMMLDANTGEVLHNENGDELRHPASLTKMMTLYLTFEALQSGRLSMTTRVPISDEAASAAPSKLDLEPGEEITIGNAIKALITKSANDVAVAIAEKISGSERAFVALMNKRASDLGMMKTNFENASGLPDDQQVTTARDMITLGLRLQDDFPTYYPLFGMRNFAYGGKSMRNHNTLLNSYQGADGIKTGYTRMSGFNLVSSVRRGGRHVVGAVFGGASAATRNGEMRILLSKALSKASLTKSRKPAPLLIVKLKVPQKSAPVLKPTISGDRPITVADVPRPQPAVRPAPKPFAPSLAAGEARIEPAVLTPTTAEPAVAPVEVYKVKRVMIEPRAKPAAAIDPDATTDMTMDELVAAATADAAPVAPSAATIGSIAAAQANDATAEPTVIASVSSKSDVISKLGAPDAAPAAAPKSQTIEAGTGADDEPLMLRGLAPSTLAAQAAALTGERQRVATLQPGANVKIKTGRHEIQIGAFDSADEAKRALADVKTKAAKVVGAAPTKTEPVQKSGRTMYRARFAGFDATAAATTCEGLRRQSIDCFVMTAE